MSFSSAPKPFAYLLLAPVDAYSHIRIHFVRILDSRFVEILTRFLDFLSEGAACKAALLRKFILVRTSWDRLGFERIEHLSHPPC